MTVIQTLTILIQRMTQMDQNQRKLIYLMVEVVVEVAAHSGRERRSRH